MIQIRKAVVLLIVAMTLTVAPLYGQFQFDKIEDRSGFYFEKPLKFYWTPRYNRVEGLFLNFGAKVRPPGLPGLQFYGDAGGGFWNEDDKQFRFTVGARQDFFEIKRLSFGAEIYKKIASADDWVVSELENSLAALLFREDYKDYYGAQGFKLYADHQFTGNHILRLEVGRQKYDALKRNIDWSVFKGDFDPNPKRGDAIIAEGHETSIRFIAALDWRDNPVFPLNGWYLEGIFEKTFDDFDTDGLFLTVKRYQQTWGNQRLLLRGMVGSRRGDILTTAEGGDVAAFLIEQYAIDLGGIGSLRGFDDKEFSGNRMVMLNANYLFGGELLQKIPLQRIPLFGNLWTTLSLALFVDTGFAWRAESNAGLLSGFDDADNLKTDVGFSILVLEGVARFDVAKRTDRSRDDFRVTFRLLEKF
jgi:outer membrane protein assembly factor BamA